MVIIKLKGGLGNQLFQYATARNLSLILKTKLFIFSNKIEKDNLEKFNISSRRISKNRYKLFLKFKSFTEYKEEYFSYNKEVLKLKNNIILDGYFQSEKYFINCRETILNDLKINKSLKSTSLDLLNEIKKTNSISIHIRRGDYAENSEVNKIHGCVSLSYYENAINLISEKTKNPVYFVFSDDISWAKSNLNIDAKVYYSEFNKNSAYEDLKLMSKCKNNIIANSSFSWWGAWLNTNPDKIIIIPKRWFKDFSLDSKDIYCNSWIRL